MTRIAEIVGDGAALALVTEFGGQMCNLPRFPGPTTRLAKAIGEDAAVKLVNALGYGRVYIPTLMPPAGASQA